jgi:hypothetical protein
MGWKWFYTAFMLPAKLNGGFTLTKFHRGLELGFSRQSRIRSWGPSRGGIRFHDSCCPRLSLFVPGTYRSRQNPPHFTIRVCIRRWVNPATQTRLQDELPYVVTWHMCFLFPGVILMFSMTFPFFVRGTHPGRQNPPNFTIRMCSDHESIRPP